ncbi:MAG TPA: T9SS type A sorting domain-containing protein [Candidatus Kapabacteria bacterium]|nr:T9SS type A sorting domain-containing protein [Candidatus Kapabacteria bacterium]
MITDIKGLVGFIKAGWIAISILLFYSTSVFAQPDSCNKLREWMAITPQSKDMYKMQYDTLRHYVESCALLDNDFSYHAFNDLNSDVSYYDTQDTTRFNKYRDWLLSVVFLNTINPGYYCACVGAMINTYQYGPYNYTNAPLAVMKFLLDNSNCKSPGLQEFYNNTINSRHESWLSKKDTTVPEDTTLPSLDDIGLGALLHHNGVSPSTAPPQIYLASFTSSPNPFKNETHLRFHLNRMAYTTIGIYDVLGHQVWGDGKGRSLEAGDHEVVVDGSLLPEGSLYARIETGFGEVRTVKLVKE